MRRLHGRRVIAGLLARAAALEDAFAADLGRPSAGPIAPERPIAFFCAEYGVHHSLPVYSGGLGALAGDLVKEASDQALPLVAVGLLYRQGYFRQRLDASGWQQEYWIDIDPERLPDGAGARSGWRAADDHGSDPWERGPRADLAGRGRSGAVVPARCHRPENGLLERWITSQLYVGDPVTRLSQYVLLGVGGVRALAAMGIEPALVHLNEGHAAFAVLELARAEVARGLLGRGGARRPPGSARCSRRTRRSAAGNETYSREDVIATLGGVAAELGVDPDVIVRLGRQRSAGRRRAVRRNAIQSADEPLGECRQPPARRCRPRDVARAVARASCWRPCRSRMSPTACTLRRGWGLRCIACSTAISVRTGGGGRATSRPGRDSTECPTPSCGRPGASSARSWWRSCKERSGIDRLAERQPRAWIEAAARAFDPDVLTIGFARRNATYKRLGLLVHDPGRAIALLAGREPIQFVLAGKAHPSDEEAKRVVQELFRVKDAPHVAERVVYLHEYDLAMAKLLVRGCDLWLNLPRPPLEASGTSGMKAVINGGLNLSVLDGWWAEAYDGTNGWALPGEVQPDHATQDARDAATLYRLLEQEVVPAFYDRDAEGLPRSWLARIRASMRTLAPAFCAGRMLDDYVERIYAPEETPDLRRVCESTRRCPPERWDSRPPLCVVSIGGERDAYSPAVVTSALTANHLNGKNCAPGVVRRGTGWGGTIAPLCIPRRMLRLLVGAMTGIAS